MSTPITRVTVQDAMRALHHITGHMDPRPDSKAGVTFGFLSALDRMSDTDTVITREGQGFILEGAMQHGFQTIDDNGDVYVVHGNALIKYVEMVRTIAAREAAQLCARQNIGPPIKISNADDLTLSRLVLEFGNTPVTGEGRLRKDVMADLRQLFGFTQMAKEQAAPSQALNPCKLPPAGWYCTRSAGHDGPCAARPISIQPPITKSMRRILLDLLQDELIEEGDLSSTEFDALYARMPDSVLAHDVQTRVKALAERAKRSK